MWCNIPSQCNARISIHGVVQGGNNADFPISGTHQLLQVIQVKYFIYASIILIMYMLVI